MKKLLAILIIGCVGIVFSNVVKAQNPFACFTSDLYINDKYCNYHQLDLPGGTLSFLRCDVIKNYNGSEYQGKRCWSMIIPE